VAKAQLTDLLIQRLKAPEKGQLTIFDTTLRGFGIRLSQGGAKTFIVVTGKERRLTTLGRYPDLTLKDARIRAKIVFAGSSSTKPTGTPKPYPEAVDAFLEARKHKMKATSLRLYKTYLNFFGFTKRVDHITRKDVTEKLKDLAGKDTAQNVAQQVLRTFFMWCVKEDILTVNPLSRVDMPNKLKSRERVLTDEELVAIWNATDYKPYGHLVRVLMLSGARRNEIAKYGTGTTHLHFEETKNNRSHTLPITPLMKQHLPVLGEPCWSEEKKKLDALCGVKNWRLHDLRRTFSTNLARLKVPIHITEKILNHVQGTLTPIARTYNRYEYEDEVREALLTYSAFILKIVSAFGGNPAYQGVVHDSSEIAHDTQTVK